MMQELNIDDGHEVDPVIGRSVVYESSAHDDDDDDDDNDGVDKDKNDNNVNANGDWNQVRKRRKFNHANIQCIQQKNATHIQKHCVAQSIDALQKILPLPLYFECSENFIIVLTDLEFRPKAARFRGLIGMYGYGIMFGQVLSMPKSNKSPQGLPTVRDICKRFYVEKRKSENNIVPHLEGPNNGANIFINLYVRKKSELNNEQSNGIDNQNGMMAVLKNGRVQRSKSLGFIGFDKVMSKQVRNGTALINLHNVETERDPWRDKALNHDENLCLGQTKKSVVNNNKVELYTFYKNISMDVLILETLKDMEMSHGGNNTDTTPPLTAASLYETCENDGNEIRNLINMKMSHLLLTAEKEAQQQDQLDQDQKRRMAANKIHNVSKPMVAFVVPPQQVKVSSNQQQTQVLNANKSVVKMASSDNRTNVRKKSTSYDISKFIQAASPQTDHTDFAKGVDKNTNNNSTDETKINTTSDIQSCVENLLENDIDLSLYDNKCQMSSNIYDFYKRTRTFDLRYVHLSVILSNNIMPPSVIHAVGMSTEKMSENTAFYCNACCDMVSVRNNICQYAQDIQACFQPQIFDVASTPLHEILNLFTLRAFSMFVCPQGYLENSKSVWCKSCFAKYVYVQIFEEKKTCIQCPCGCECVLPLALYWSFLTNEARMRHLHCLKYLHQIRYLPINLLTLLQDNQSIRQQQKKQNFIVCPQPLCNTLIPADYNDNAIDKITDSISCPSCLLNICRKCHSIHSLLQNQKETTHKYHEKMDHGRIHLPSANALPGGVGQLNTDTGNSEPLLLSDMGIALNESHLNDVDDLYKDISNDNNFSGDDEEKNDKDDYDDNVNGEMGDMSEDKDDGEYDCSDNEDKVNNTEDEEDGEDDDDDEDEDEDAKEYSETNDKQDDTKPSQGYENETNIINQQDKSILESQFLATHSEPLQRIIRICCQNIDCQCDALSREKDYNQDIFHFDVCIDPSTSSSVTGDTTGAVFGNSGMDMSFYYNYNNMVAEMHPTNFYPVPSSSSLPMTTNAGLANLSTATVQERHQFFFGNGFNLVEYFSQKFLQVILPLCPICSSPCQLDRKHLREDKIFISTCHVCMHRHCFACKMVIPYNFFHYTLLRKHNDTTSTSANIDNYSHRIHTQTQLHAPWQPHDHFLYSHCKAHFEDYNPNYSDYQGFMLRQLVDVAVSDVRKMARIPLHTQPYAQYVEWMTFIHDCMVVASRDTLLQRAYTHCFSNTRMQITPSAIAYMTMLFKSF